MSLNTAAYLERIKYRGPLEPTAATLRDLHRAHMLAVPFENLDIHLGREIVLDEQRVYSKIVDGRRGGFC
ncbi:MAG TPA: arylamine N-acetyltransferase, partial [Blastocatellia bacterium]|nr:arylamine N-acetyltransferase [Blastocatellia bacterium]